MSDPLRQRIDALTTKRAHLSARRSATTDLNQARLLRAKQNRLNVAIATTRRDLKKGR